MARDAALAYLTRIAERIERDLALVEQIPPVLHDLARTILAAQRLLHCAVAATQASPITVVPTGR